MPDQITTLEGETLDGILYRVRGNVNSALLDEIYTLNPEVSDYGTQLPAGLTITVPDASVPVKPLIKLWD